MAIGSHAADVRHTDSDGLRAFCTQVFVTLGLSPADAAVSADVLVAADLRGIPSHGVARLRRYVNGLKSGLMLARAESTVLTETQTSIVVDAAGGMGPPVSVRTMRTVMHKAAEAGMALGTVRESNHFGIAGYYAMLALEHDMIGLAMSNTAALGVPTFGAEAMFGTNPLAFAAPADAERAFVLDMSTTTVSRGKVEHCLRQGKPLPLGWAVDRTGEPTADAARVLDDMQHRRGGGLLPLGGAGELLSGYKGYGLAVMVDILCAALSGAPFGPDIRDTATSSARVSHAFAAIRVSAFRDPDAFRRDMDRMLGGLRACRAAAGEPRVYFAGLKEFERETQFRRDGVPLLPETCRELAQVAAEQGVALPPGIE